MPVGTIISSLVGHFSDTVRLDTVAIVKTKNGTDAEDQDEYQIRFNNSDPPLRRVAREGGRLVSEGDLNSDGLEEFSVFADPHHGCTFTFTTLTRSGGKWHPLFPSFLIPTACDPVTDSELESRVYQDSVGVRCIVTDVDGNRTATKILLSR